jgi:hypothetical protein
MNFERSGLIPVCEAHVEVVLCVRPQLRPPAGTTYGFRFYGIEIVLFWKSLIVYRICSCLPWMRAHEMDTKWRGMRLKGLEIGANRGGP